jgi:predicted permease
MLHDLLYRLRAILRREKFEGELDEELRFHIECEARKNAQSGVSASEARRTAQRAFGGLEQIGEECRDARGTRLFEDFAQDCHYALRTIRKNLAFSSLVVLVLALGIGANTAVFSIVHDVILKPLPFRNPSKLLAVWDTYLPQFSKVGISPVELQSWQAQHDLFEETAWYRYVPLDGNLAVSGREPIAVHADLISSNLFSLLGTAALIGRNFASAEPPQSAILSNHLWRSRFAANPAVIGKTVRFNDNQLTIVGVMPPQGQFPDWADLWLPNGPLLSDQLTNPVRHALGFVARMRPNVDEKQASARLFSIAQRLAKEHPKTSTGWGMRVSGLQNDLTGDVRPPLLLLLGAASLLLLIATANIASLLLARASARTREMAIRTAIGARPLRIIRQLLTESLVLALLGGACGWLFAKASLWIALPAHAHLEPGVILFLFLASLLTGFFFGLAPAIQALRTNPQSVIKSASVTSSGLTTRSVLVVFEFALTLTLVIGAGILTRSFVRLMHASPGFNSKGVLTLRLLVPPSRKPEPLFHRIQEKLLGLPAVQFVAVTNSLPLLADGATTSRFNVPGSSIINPDALPAAQIRTVSPDYFRAMQVSVQSGRVFSEHDLNDPVCVINQTMAKRFWPGRDPVGTKFITGPWGPNPTWSTIIGVVADVKQFGLASEPTVDIYYPGLGAQYLVMKTAADPLTLASAVERTLHAIDPELAISDVRSMDQITTESARTRRWTMALLAAFAGFAFLLALVGIYGVMAWTVSQRTRELGIRMALGAQRNQVLALLLRYGIKLSLAGLLLGLLASYALRRALSGLVYGVSTADPLIYLSVPAFMLIATLAACYFPARKASGVDPLISLRYD